MWGATGARFTSMLMTHNCISFKCVLISVSPFMIMLVVFVCLLIAFVYLYVYVYLCNIGRISNLLPFDATPELIAIITTRIYLCVASVFITFQTTRLKDYNGYKTRQQYNGLWPVYSFKQIMMLLYLKCFLN